MSESYNDSSDSTRILSIGNELTEEDKKILIRIDNESPDTRAMNQTVNRLNFAKYCHEHRQTSDDNLEPDSTQTEE